VPWPGLPLGRETCRCIAKPLAERKLTSIVVVTHAPGLTLEFDEIRQVHCFFSEVVMADWVEAGKKAPDFTLPADDGGKVKLSALEGKPVVLYFYPRDNTPGCTREACAFRDQQTAMNKLGVVVLGVSPDTVASHEKFRDKLKLNFPLLADADHTVAEKYGAWREKTLYGNKSMGIQRSTFLIDASGKVAKVWKKVNVDGHDEQVLAALKELG
jgi:peroxiredoxin Q/BCP